MNKRLVSMNLTNPQTHSFKKKPHISVCVCVVCVPVYRKSNVGMNVLGVSSTQNQSRTLYIPSKSPTIEQYS